MKAGFKLLGIAFGLLLAATAAADGMSVRDAHARETPPGATTGGAYLTLVNEGERADRLLAAETGIAGTVELHASVRRDGVATMQRLDGVDVPAGGTVELAPGGMHIMLIGLAEPLRAGQRFPLTLVFENAGRITVDVVVRDMRSGGSGAPHRGHD